MTGGDPTNPDVWVEDEPEPVGRLLDAKGNVLVTVWPKRRPFGFQPSRNRE